MGKIYDMAYSAGICVFKQYFAFDYSLRGESLPPAAIIASNHSSRLDGLVLCAGLGEKIVFLSKAKSYVWPYMPSKVGRIDLEKHGIRKSLSLAKKKIEEGYYFGIFPEGKYIPEGMSEFNSGLAFFAQHLELPVVPISIRGVRTIWPRNQERPSRHGKIILNIGDPIEMQESADKKTFCENIRQEVKKLYEEHSLD